MKLMPHQSALLDAFFDAACKRVIRLDGDVGLGKSTALAALSGRLLEERPDARILVLLPAALRWDFVARAQESGSQALLVDRYRFREMLDAPGFQDVWPRGLAVVMSQDFAKQGDVLESLAGSHWDLLIADEAHTFRGTRGEALRRLMTMAGRVVLALQTNTEPPIVLPTEDTLVVSWHRERLVGDDGTALDAVPRPLLHEVGYSLTAAERRVRATVLALGRRVGASGSSQDWLAQSSARCAQSSPAAIERLLRRLAEGWQRDRELWAELQTTW